MIWGRTKDELADGQPTIGRFRPAGTESGWDPGLLRWSPSSGASIDLADATADWPTEFTDETLTVHGELRDGSEVTLLSARVQQLALGNLAQRITSSGLAIGELTDPGERWPNAAFTTQNLYPWRDQRGLKVSRPNIRARPDHLRFDWQPPSSNEVNVKGALSFGTGMIPQAGAEMPTWSMMSIQRVGVRPSQPLTMTQMERRYAIPLLALTGFGANKPDAITYEAYWNADRRRRVELWWMGRTAGTTQWRPGKDKLLVDAADLVDFSKAIRRWWRLHEKVWPALGIFGDYVGHGSNYSPARFLTLYTAVEGYCKKRHGHKDLKRLRSYTGIPHDVIACTNTALALIGVSRNYFAHLGNTGQKFTRQQVEDNVYDSTRRLEALMQASLLRELGFSASNTENKLANYYANWPLPSEAP